MFYNHFGFLRSPDIWNEETHWSVRVIWPFLALWFSTCFLNSVCQFLRNSLLGFLLNCIKSIQSQPTPFWLQCQCPFWLQVSRTPLQWFAKITETRHITTWSGFVFILTLLNPVTVFNTNKNSLLFLNQLMLWALETLHCPDFLPKLMNSSQFLWLAFCVDQHLKAGVSWGLVVNSPFLLVFQSDGFKFYYVLI